MTHLRLGVLLAGALCAQAGEPDGDATPDPAALAVVDVRAAETAFAASMAARDLSALAGFVSTEALFFGRTLLRGRAAVVEGWAPFFQDPQPPFSWEPETVEALDSGSLALSCGPVCPPERE